MTKASVFLGLLLFLYVRPVLGQAASTDLSQIRELQAELAAQRDRISALHEDLQRQEARIAALLAASQAATIPRATAAQPQTSVAAADASAGRFSVYGD